MSQADPTDRGAAKRSIDRSPSAGSKDDAVGSAGRIAAIGRRLAEIKAEHADLEAARAALELELSEIAQASHSAAFATATVTGRSPSSAKVDLFRRLFKGRTDVLPVRWENSKTSKAGYSPACANEWARGICAKPQVKCGQCPHQAFVPLSDDIITRHLRGGSTGAGNFVAGVYPLPPISTRRTGSRTPRPFLKPAEQSKWLLPSSARARATEATCGYSSTNPFPQPPPARWVLR